MAVIVNMFEFNGTAERRTSSTRQNHVAADFQTFVTFASFFLV